MTWHVLIVHAWDALQGLIFIKKNYNVKVQVIPTVFTLCLIRNNKNHVIFEVI